MIGCGGSSDMTADAVCGDGAGSEAASPGLRRLNMAGAAAVAIMAGSLLLAGTIMSGCAGAGRGRIPPGLPVSREPLPGSDRHFPSQDPANQPRPGAPDAFPDPDGPRSEPGSTHTQPVGGQAIREPAGQAFYQVQVFASGSAESAREKAMEIAERLYLPVRVIREGGLHLVRVGEADDRGEAERLLQLTIDLGFRDAMVIESQAVR